MRTYQTCRTPAEFNAGYANNITPPVVATWEKFSGFYDIEPFALTDFQPLVGFGPEDYQHWNPITSVTPEMPSTLLVTGERESPWLHEMTSAYASALGEAGVRTHTIDAPSECHFSVLSAIGSSKSELHRRVLDHISAAPS